MIPVNEPLLGQREKELLSQCIDTGWISSDGPFVKEFEERFAEYLGVKYGIAVCNGTAALEAAVAAIGIEPGDEVIMPDFTIISCAMAVVRCGGAPVLVDVQPDTWNMDVSRLEARITPRTKAIMPVHIYGHPVDMDAVMALAKKYNLTVIEDAAEAHGAEYKGRKAGGIGHINCFSFYANKIITTGEGGMVVTNDADLAQRARSLRNLCFKPERRFYHSELGYNYRMTNMQAALGLAQLERIDEFIRIKRNNARLYNERLKTIPGLQLPVENPRVKNVYWMYAVVLDESIGMDALEFARRLAEKGVGSRPFFLGMHQQPVFQRMGLFRHESYPVSRRIAKYGLYLPSGLTMTEEQVETACTAVREILA